MHHLRLILRRFKLSKGFTAINFIGIFLGMLTSIIILQYVFYERSFDRFNQYADDIYRLSIDFVSGDESRVSYADTFPLLWRELKADFPEIEEAGKIEYAYDGNQFEYQKLKNRFREEQTYWVTKGFWDMFSYTLIAGSESQIFTQPNTVAISESTAIKYFEDENPIGKSLIRNGTERFEVIGVFEDVPANSHLQFDVLLTQVNEEADETSWRSWGSNSFIKVKPEHIESLSSKLVHYLDKFTRSKLHRVELFTQPLTKIHFDNSLEADPTVKADEQNVNLLYYVALLIMVVAWINHANLSISSSIKRTREIGIRKVLGSSKSQISHLLLLENFIIHFIALIAAISFAYMAIPHLNTHFGLNIPQLGLTNALWIYLILFLIIGLFISSFYPIVILIYLRIVEGLKGSIRLGQGIVLRRFIVVIQYSSALILLIITMTIFQQVGFMRNATLGINREQTIVVNSPSIRGEHIHDELKLLKQKLLSNSSITEVAFSSDVPGRPVRYDFGGIKTTTQATGHQFKLVVADPGFANFYGLQFVAGRNFDESRISDVGKVFVNQAALDLLEITTPEEAIGKELSFPLGNVFILGVVKNFHASSVKDPIVPTIFHNRPPHYPFGLEQISIRVSGDIAKTRAIIEDTYMEVFHQDIFASFYMDDYFEEQYVSDQTFGVLFGFFSIVAIIITILGVLGMITFSVLRKLKEVSIRKVLGATSRQLIYYLSKEFLILATISSLIVVPIGYVLIDSWLDNFAQRIFVDGQLFLFPTIALFIITLLVVSSKTSKAATSNPVKHLKQDS